MLDRWNRPSDKAKVYFGETDPDADRRLNSFGWVVRRDNIDEQNGIVTRYQIPEADTDLRIIDLTPDHIIAYRRSLNRYLLYDDNKADVRVIGIPLKPKFPTNSYNQTDLLTALVHKGYSIVDQADSRTVVVGSIQPPKPETP